MPILVNFGFVSAPDRGYDMTVRHQVQNLRRCGNIFCWRPRLPAYLERNIGSRHLAFSFRQSDHRQAGYIVRKLNLLLFEIAQMNDHMEELRFAGQRMPGGFHQLDNLSADLEVGWAYRLLEKFGTRHILFESEACQGWRFLKQSYVPDSLYQGIVTTYRDERADAEGSRFNKEMRSLMEGHGLSYSILNLEKAKAEYFKARADVLLNTEERYLIEYLAEPIEPKLLIAAEN